jgi:hypothetical protein
VHPRTGGCAAPDVPAPVRMWELMTCNCNDGGHVKKLIGFVVVAALLAACGTSLKNLAHPVCGISTSPGCH